MTTSGPDERLSAYYDGELSAAERAEVERLLTERSDLRSELSGLANLSQRLNELADDQPEFDLRPRLLKQIENSRRTPSPLVAKLRQARRRTWLPMLLTACSLALLAAVSWPLLSTSDNSPQLAQHKGSDAILPAPAAAITENAAEQEIHVGSHAEELGFNTLGTVANTEMPSSAPVNVAVPSEEVRKDGSGPSEVLAKIEKTRGLKAGEIISRMIDTDHSPMLVEYTVVDVIRSAQSVEILLKEHGIQPLIHQGAEALTEHNVAAAPLKVYLLDAETVTLNTAIQEFKDLQEVVATNVESFDFSPPADMYVAGVPRPVQADGFGLPLGVPESKPNSLPFDSARSRSARAMKESTTGRFEKTEGSGVPQLQSPAQPTTVTSNEKETLGQAAKSASEALSTQPLIAGNSLVVENSEEVYAELQQLLPPEKRSQSSSTLVQDTLSLSSAEANVETGVKDQLGPGMRSRNSMQNWTHQRPAFQRPTRSRQRAFLVLHSQAEWPVLPPPPPQPESLKTPD